MPCSVPGQAHCSAGNQHALSVFVVKHIFASCGWSVGIVQSALCRRVRGFVAPGNRHTPRPKETQSRKGVPILEHKQRTREVERHLTSLEAHMQCVSGISVLRSKDSSIRSPERNMMTSGSFGKVRKLLWNLYRWVILAMGLRST